MRWCLAACLLVASAFPLATQAQPRIIPALVNGDEPQVVTEHRVRTRSGPLAYRATVGRLPIRDQRTGEIHGWIGFVAYAKAPKRGEVRPLSFVWNGGGAWPSVLTHAAGFGPRVIQDIYGDSMVDNPDTLLQTSDLVFYDPVTSGFSRPARPEFVQEFLTTLGDMAATTEFIRQYRLKFGARRQPVFLIGESLGTWRAAAVQDMMTKRGDRIAGSVLISASGGATSFLPNSYTQAGYVQSRVAAALHFKRLDPELMKDPAATLQTVTDWAFDVYRPALEGIDRLTPAQRETIAADLARYTGVPADRIDRKTLFMTNIVFRQTFFAGDKTRELNMHDLRQFGETRYPQARVAANYIREELGYPTDLTYDFEEQGYETTPQPANAPPKPGWIFDHLPGAQAEALRRVSQGGGAPPALPWLQSAMGIDKWLRVMIPIGIYDSLNSCEETVRATRSFGPDIAARFVNVCYDGGHMMYEHPDMRAKLNADIQRFMKETLVSGGWIGKWAGRRSAVGRPELRP